MAGKLRSYKSGPKRRYDSLEHRQNNKTQTITQQLEHRPSLLERTKHFTESHEAGNNFLDQVRLTSSLRGSSILHRPFRSQKFRGLVSRCLVNACETHGSGSFGMYQRNNQKHALYIFCRLLMALIQCCDDSLRSTAASWFDRYMIKQSLSLTSVPCQRIFPIFTRVPIIPASIFEKAGIPWTYFRSAVPTA